MTRSQLRSAIREIVFAQTSDAEKALLIAMRFGEFVCSNPTLTRVQEQAITAAVTFSAETTMQNFARVGWALAVLGEDES